MTAIPSVLSPAAAFVPFSTKIGNNRQSKTAPLCLASTRKPSDEATSISPLLGLKVAIAGAGPSGLLLAHRLLAAGASSVDIFEARNDPRSGGNLEGRAYALGVGIRGRTAIRSVDNELWNSVKARGFESERFNLYVSGIKINLRDTPRTKNANDVEPSVLAYQTDLCAALLDELDTRPGKSRVKIKFQHRITECDLDKKTLLVKSKSSSDTERVGGNFDLIVGCDGVNSVVRASMQAASSAFQCEKEKLPGDFKICRLSASPPKLDPTSVALLLPKEGRTTCFVEPTVNGTSCILFAGRESDVDPILNSSSNRTATAEAILSRFPLLEGSDLDEITSQLETQKKSTASAVKTNIYHYGSVAAICGDAAHATGGVSGQGVNSALVDSCVLADCLELLFDPGNREDSLHQALLAYSQRQVPEGYALYDLSFGPSPKGVLKKLGFAFSTARDTLFRGRFGIGQPPLQTLLTTSLRSFSEIRRDRGRFYDEPFPDAASFNQTVANVYSRQE